MHNFSTLSRFLALHLVRRHFGCGAEHSLFVFHDLLVFSEEIAVLGFHLLAQDEGHLLIVTEEHARFGAVPYFIKIQSGLRFEFLRHVWFRLSFGFGLAFVQNFEISGCFGRDERSALWGDDGRHDGLGHGACSGQDHRGAVV